MVYGTAAVEEVGTLFWVVVEVGVLFAVVLEAPPSSPHPPFPPHPPLPHPLPPQLPKVRLTFCEEVAEAVARPVALADPEAEAAALSITTDSLVAVGAGPVTVGRAIALMAAKSMF